MTGTRLAKESAYNWATREVVFSPDGTMLIEGGQPNGIGLWSVRPISEAPLERMGRLGGYFGQDTLSPDGTKLASGNAIWDLTTGRQIAVLDVSGSMAFSPDGTLLVTESGIWNTTTWDRLITLDVGESVTFSFDGTMLISLKEGKVWLWGVPSGE